MVASWRLPRLFVVLGIYGCFSVVLLAPTIKVFMGVRCLVSDVCVPNDLVLGQRLCPCQLRCIVRRETKQMGGRRIMNNHKRQP